MNRVSDRPHIAVLIPQLVVIVFMVLSGCIPPPPHQFVPGGPLGEAGQTVQGPRQASDEEVRAMLAESSRHQSTPPERVDLNRLLTQISQATNFRQKQRLVDQYHHAALLLPEAERDQAFQRLRALETPGTMTK
jgi:hypothetical protein